MPPGAVFAAPVSESGWVRSPYLREAHFVPSQWLPSVVIAAEHALGYLTADCVAVLTVVAPPAQCPTLDELRTMGPWRVDMPGTCSASHFTRMQVHAVGRVPVCPSVASGLAPNARSYMQVCAAQDVSIAIWLRARGHIDESLATLDALSV